MFILVLIFILFASLHWWWPYIITGGIKQKDGGGEERAGWLIWVAAAWVIAFWLALVALDSKHSWTEPTSAITAVGITVAVFFSYSRLLPPSFYAAYLEVMDNQTGDFNKDRKLDELAIKKGQWSPILIIVHNTSVFTWDNYRISMDLPGGFEARETAPGFPNSEKWTHSPKSGSLKIGQNPCHVQIHSVNVLAVGDSFAIRFFVKSSDASSDKVKIMVSNAGRLSERRRWLLLKVKNG